MVPILRRFGELQDQGVNGTEAREVNMRYLKYLALVAVLMVPFAYSQAQVSVGIGVGPGYIPAGAPVCAYGYYGYYPYACAPYGYYSPDWFVGGVFVGAGPWFHGPGWLGRWGYASGWRGRPWYGHPGWGRGWYGGHGYVARGPVGGYHGGVVAHGYHGAPAFHGGESFHGGYHGGGGFHGGGRR